MLRKNFIRVNITKVYMLALYLLYASLLSNNLATAGWIGENLLSRPVADNTMIFHTLPSTYNYRATCCILKACEGFMCFGTGIGLKINNTPIDITTEFSPLNKPLYETDILILNHRRSSFSIDFATLNYLGPGQNQFVYILKGYDEDWSYIGKKTNAHYTKVKPGHYTFKVKAASNDGIWNDVPTSMYIIIEPPLWKTTWAYLVYAISFIAIITFIFRFWQERIHIRNQLKLEILAKEKEHKLNERNLQFFTGISHEFRTPLSLVIGSVESLLDSSPGEMHEQLKVIQRNSHRLLTLTNNLMDLRKLEDGGMQINIRKEDIRICTETILSYFNARINKLNIRLSVNYPESENIYWFDKEKFATIMINLVSNALKYTPEKGSIRIVIKYHRTKKQLEVSVVNTGIGIHSTELPNIFDKFYQTSSGKNQKQFGTGIGLTLTRGLVELHGGKIWVTSIPNHETNFTFTIPVKKPDDKVEDLQTEPSHVSVPDFYFEDYEAEETAADETENEQSIILIVEDNADLRLFLKSELEADYSIVLAGNGQEGLQKAKEYTPDLIISDIIMPVMSGIELCKAIKTDVRTSHIPIVLLTAKSTTNEQIEGLDCGASAYITKPFHLKLLQTQVANLIHSRKELYAQFSRDVYIMPRKKTSSKIDQKFLQNTIDFIVENVNNNKLNIENLARFHNMSHRNFYRKIKALTGNTVVEFIKIIRLKQALTLIESNQYNISEISYMTGFSSPSYFAKSFREFYGKPPSDYLNQ